MSSPIQAGLDLVPELRFEVLGIPAPQGSKRHVGNGVMVEMSKRLPAWRLDVKDAAQGAIAACEWPLDAQGAVHVDYVFRFPRPRSHFGTGRNIAMLRHDAPAYVTSQAFGDQDKLERSTADAMESAGVFKNDAQVVSSTAVKRYCNRGELPGASIRVTLLGRQS